MADYIKGIVFITIFIYFLAHLGKKIRKKDDFSANLIVGYVTYTVLQFFGGFISQQLRLPWIVYQSYMIILLICLIGFSLYHNRIVVSKSQIKSHFKKYWILYTIAFVLVILSCLNLQFQWNANNVDDGYYLNKIRMAPYVGNYTDFNYAVGIPAPGSLIRNINTFELNAAFYTQILGMEASIFAKVFLAFFNLTFVLHVIYQFYMTVLGGKRKGNRLALAVIPILFFGIYYGIQTNYGLLALNDSWQNSTAMWYGSTLVKTAGLFLLLLPVFNQRRLTRNWIIFYIGICITLFSKASQTLPLLLLVFIIYSIRWLFSYVKRRANIKVALLMFAVIIIGLIILPQTAGIHSRADLMNTLLSNNMKIVVRLSLFLIALSYVLPYPLLRKWNTWLLLIGVFMLVPRLNTLFLYSSMYDFVASRTFEAYLYAIMMTAALVLFLGIIKFIKSTKMIYVIYGGIAICLISVPLISIHKNLGIKHTIQVLVDNPKLIPSSTLELGSKLEMLSKETNTKLNVLMPMWLVLDGTPYDLASSVRYNAFDIISVGSIVRYNEQMDNSVYKGLDQNELDVFEKYNSGEDRNDKKMKQFLKKYPINCIVVYYDDVAEKFEKDFGFTLKGKIPLSDKVHSYYILYKGK